MYILDFRHPIHDIGAGGSGAQQITTGLQKRPLPARRRASRASKALSLPVPQDAGNTGGRPPPPGPPGRSLANVVSMSPA